MMGETAHAGRGRAPRFEALPDLVFEVDAELRLTAVHVGSEADLHASPEQFLGRRAEDMIPPEVFRAFVAAREEAHRSRAVASYEYRLRTQTRGPQDFEGRCVPLDDGGTLLVVRNVSARRGRRAAAALTALQASVDASAELGTIAGLVEWLEAQVREGIDDEQADARRENADAVLETLAEVGDAVARLRQSAADLGGDAARLAGARPPGAHGGGEAT
jgi:PAS domain-containing protein